MARRSFTERLDAFQRDHTWACVPLAVTHKFADDQGGYPASLITYNGFLSLFPWLLLIGGMALLGATVLSAWASARGPTVPALGSSSSPAC